MARTFRLGPPLNLNAGRRGSLSAAAMERRTIREIMLRSGDSWDQARAEAEARGLVRPQKGA